MECLCLKCFLNKYWRGGVLKPCEMHTLKTTEATFVYCGRIWRYLHKKFSLQRFIFFYSKKYIFVAIN